MEERQNALKKVVSINHWCDFLPFFKKMKFYKTKRLVNRLYIRER